MTLIIKASRVATCSFQISPRWLLTLWEIESQSEDCQLLVAGLGLPFNNSMYRPVEEWPRIHQWVRGGAIPNPQADQENEATMIVHASRIQIAAAILRDTLKRTRPDVLLVLGADHGRMFSGVQRPQFSTYLGEELWGSTSLEEFNEPASENIIRVPGAPAIAQFVQEELVFHEFDMSYSQFLNPMGQPKYGYDLSVLSAVRMLTPLLDIPVVSILVNTQHHPMPTGKRCREFGQVLGTVLDEMPERIAIMASGGLSHDHHGHRAGFIDDELDRWFLKAVERGKSERLQAIFDVDSDSGQGGTAELRLWLATAAACETVGAKANVVDYFPSYTAAAGMGFAYWER